uniref:Uncharacterized protein n=1 Tax=Nelumbo nucifera TaxID=4432 RepID=A0A822XQN7_NELNU|nr:TPA_asm: hypothetical protein HUJ06_022882 [Nelumbo nucifera]
MVAGARNDLAGQGSPSMRTENREYRGGDNNGCWGKNRSTGARFTANENREVATAIVIYSSSSSDKNKEAATRTTVVAFLMTAALMVVAAAEAVGAWSSAL